MTALVLLSYLFQEVDISFGFGESIVCKDASPHKVRLSIKCGQMQFTNGKNENKRRLHPNNSLMKYQGFNLHHYLAKCCL